MIGDLRRVSLLVLAFTIFAPLSSALADVPFLRWERGQVQEIVLGGVITKDRWTIQLQGEGVEALIFSESVKGTGDYLIYSLMIPESAPVGPYTVVGTKPSGEIKIIATVQLLGVTKYEIVKVPRDLAFIIGILIFITAFASTLRAKKYSELSFPSTQELYQEDYSQEKKKISIAKRIAHLPYSMRSRALAGFETSLFKYLMLREGELVHRVSRQLYALLPLAGFAGGMVAANETDRAGGIAASSLAVFIAMALIGILDAYSGILAVLGFWFFELSMGNISSFRDILLMMAVGIGWLGPIYAFSIFRTSVAQDFYRKSTQGPQGAAAAIGILFGAIFGASTFFLGHKLINSILIEIGAQRQISTATLLIITVALLIRGFADKAIVKISSEKVPTESITIARVNSPQTAFVVSILTFGYVYLWTQSSQTALIISAMFTAPFVLLLIRFSKFRIKFLAKVPRNILIEAAVVTVAAYLTFRQISSAPFLVEERARQFLVFAGIPAIVHAIYSVACDSSDRVGIIEK
ncbi:MAG: hypothetical protein QNK54_03715 [Candidatus Planktophila sp.]